MKIFNVKNKLLILCISFLIVMMQGTLWALEVNLVQVEEKTEEVKCPKPYIKRIKPLTALPGTKVLIYGHRFGTKIGSVIFTDNVSGQIVSWKKHRIEVIVPEGAITGNIVVVLPCSTKSNIQSFNIKDP